MSKVYLKGTIGTTVNSKKNSNFENRELKLEDFKAKSLKKAYLNKESIILKRTLIFCIQCLIMPIIYPVVILVIIIGILAFAKLSVPNLWNRICEILSTSFGTSIFIAVGQIFYMTSFSSIIAVSRESKYAKLVKYLPIDLNQQFKYKLNIGIKINTVVAVMVSICNYLCIQDFAVAISVFLSLTLLNVIGEKFKLLTDLKSPKLDWDSEYTMMKQNTNVMNVLFYALIVVGIVLGISKIIENRTTYLIVVIAILIIIDSLLNRHIRKNKEKIFSRVY